MSAVEARVQKPKRSRHLIEVPPYYHGPVDFPCYGCATRTIAEFYDRKISTNSLLFQGGLRYAYPYTRGIGVKLVPESWERQGFCIPHEEAASLAGLQTRYLDTSSARPFEEIWAEWRSYLDADIPVVITLIGVEILWRAAGLETPLNRAPHTAVVVGYDEERKVAIIHDNWWHYETTGKEDIRYIEVPLTAIEEALNKYRGDLPQLGRQTYVVAGKKAPEQEPLSEIIRVQGEMMLGRRMGLHFKVIPGSEGSLVGGPALHAAAEDFTSVPDLEALKRLITGMTRLLLRNNWQGIEGQPARAAWLSGVSAVTRNANVEAASFHLDVVADAYCRARHAFQKVVNEVQRGATLEVVRPLLEQLAHQLRRAGDAECKAGEALLAAAPELKKAGY